MDRQMKRKPAWALLGSVSVLLAGELGLRLYARSITEFKAHGSPVRVEAPGDLMVPSPDPLLVYELYRNIDVIFRGVRLRTNSHGMRGLEVATRKPPGVFRIAVLGDSVAMGWRIRGERTYAALLEKKLRARCPGRKVEVLNFGVQGYNTVQEYRVLRDKALAFDPDLVILGYVGNDLERQENQAIRGLKPAVWAFRHAPRVGTMLRHTVACQTTPALRQLRWLRYGRPFIPRLKSLGFSGRLYKRGKEFLRTPLYSLNFAALKVQALMGRMEPGRHYDWRYYREREKDPPRSFFKAFHAIGSLCRERGIPAIVLMDSRYVSWGITHTRLAAMSKDLGMDAVDLFKLYRRLPESTPIERAVSIEDEHNLKYIFERGLGKDNHPNELWHRRTADVLFARITARGFLRPPHCS